jgi:hypothetical protein
LVENRDEIDKFKKNLVYKRRLKSIPQFTHVQESDQSPSMNKTNSNFFFPVLQDKIPATQNEIRNPIVHGNIDLPVAIRNGIIEYTKRPLSRLSKSGLYFRSKGNSKIGTCKIAIKIEEFYSRTFVESIQESVKSQSKYRWILPKNNNTKYML